MLAEVTPLILTYNEAPNIARTLEKLRWAKRIVVLDSFSTDETCDIVRRYSQAEIIQRKFDSFAGQCNFGLQQIQTPWVLSLDADYVLSDELIQEMQRCVPGDGLAGYSARFKYCIDGKALRSALYPPRTILYRQDKARYRDEGHGHRVQLEGSTQMFAANVFHDDRKPFDRWLQEQNKYMTIEARNLLQTPLRELNLQDRIRRRIVFAPLLVFFYTLLGKGLVLDGLAGWHYVFQRTLAETLLSLRLIEARLKGEKKS